MRAIEAGVFNEATQKRIAELQARKEALDDAIAAETVRQSLFEDEYSIRAYYDRFLHADFDNAEVRDSVMEYFVDKIYLHEDRLVVASWYSEDNREVPMEVLDGETEDPFAEGEAVRFDCFPSGSTPLTRPRPMAGPLRPRAPVRRRTDRTGPHPPPRSRPAGTASRSRSSCSRSTTTS